MADTTMNLDGVDRRFSPTGSGVLRPVLGAMARAILRALEAGRARRAVMASARESASVRALAHRYRESDRGFAADLYAAADRHEGAVAGR
jgi:hypothetical protein